MSQNITKREREREKGGILTIRCKCEIHFFNEK
jgi:hypothetical protein